MSDIEYNMGSSDCKLGAIYAEKDGKAVGFVEFRSRDDNTSIREIEVDKDWRGIGIGTGLYIELCKFLKKQCPDIKTVTGRVADGAALRARIRAFGMPEGWSDERVEREVEKLNEESQYSVMVENKINRCNE